MKFKENFKRFFTLDRHHDAGFTLVELIVVIAILAILAGVAVPAYTGYIKKAEESADLQLLGALNTAFAAACLQNTVDVDDMIGAEVVLVDKKVSTIDISGTTAYAEEDAKASAETLVGGALLQKNLNEAFALFFGENMNTEFKVYIEIVYAKGGFQGFTAEDKGTLGGAFTDAFNKIKDSVAGSIANLNGSAFGNIGAQGLMTKLDSVTGLAVGLFDEADKYDPEAGTGSKVGAALKENLQGDLMNIAAMMGYTPDEFQQKMIDLGPDAAAYQNELLANYAVLKVADSVNKVEAGTHLGNLDKAFEITDITDMMTSADAEATQEGMAQAAMLYAMYTSYANGLEGDAKIAADQKLTSIDTFATAIPELTKDGSDFRKYLAGAEDCTSSSNATNDMNGFLGAMNIINSTTTGEDVDNAAIRDMLENGYNNTELINALQGLMGSK